MSCRDEILDCARHIIRNKGHNRFTVVEIVNCMQARATDNAESTIRTHVVSRMCANAPAHHAVTYDDFERISHGTYRIRD